MTTLVSRRTPDMAYTAFLFLIPVIFYWVYWTICMMSNDSPLKSEIMLRSLFPRKIMGLPINLVAFILTSVSLFFSVSAKLRRKTRWYKTPFRIRLGIGLGMLLMFVIFLQALM
ncbi:MAG: hypothetical protein KA444_01275 [Bacteroidia bacterium]|nr:hypothetical protein [Bacteroidia bacterium]